MGRKQNRIRSTDTFKVYRDIFELTKYSPKTLRKRVDSIVRKGNHLEKRYNDGKIKYWDYHNRINELKIQWDTTARALLFKQNFKKTMKKFPIILKSRS